MQAFQTTTTEDESGKKVYLKKRLETNHQEVERKEESKQKQGRHSFEKIYMLIVLVCLFFFLFDRFCNLNFKRVIVRLTCHNIL